MAKKSKKQTDITVRDQILKAALSLAEEGGWENVSLRKVVRKLGLSTTVVYTNFGSKDVMLAALASQGFSELMRMWKKAYKSKKSPKQTMRMFATSYWNFAFEHQKLYEIMHSIGEASYHTEKSPIALKKVKNTIFPILQSLSDQKLDQQELTNRFYMFWSFMHGCVSLTLDNNIKGGNDKSEVIYQMGIDSLIKSLRK